jgi:hypothetical protein
MSCPYNGAIAACRQRGRTELASGKPPRLMCRPCVADHARVQTLVTAVVRERLETVDCEIANREGVMLQKIAAHEIFTDVLRHGDDWPDAQELVVAMLDTFLAGYLAAKAIAARS